LAGLKELHWLTLAASPGRGLIRGTGFRECAELPELEELRIDNLPITDESLQYIGRYQNLNVLTLQGTQVHGQGLGHLVHLRKLGVLTLDESPVGDEALPHLKRLKTLVGLSARATKLTRQALADLRISLPNCEIVSDEPNP
jgi:hypothetical protein